MLIRVFLIVVTLFSLTWTSGKTNLPSKTPLEEFVQAGDFSVTFYPPAPYHVGDVISARIAYHGQLNLSNQEITVALASAPETPLAAAKFSQYRPQATFYWALNTQESPPGFLDLTFQIPEADLTWTSGFNLLPTPPDRGARWESTQTSCCVIHYLSGTDAAADIQMLREVLETETSQVIGQFFPEGLPEGTQPFEEPINLVLVPAVVGHGGFATDEAVMTYSHRNWAGTGIAILAHHEIVHVMDRLLNDGPRPSLLAEGLAVYLSGGHYHEGPILEQAAALLDLNAYLPLTSMVDDFYAAQHETSYIEAGALVAYLVDIWGWETFIEFYFTLPDAGSDSQSIAQGLQNQFGTDLASLEADFIQYLQTHTPGQAVIADVRLTIAAYDTLRRYQALAVPSAHFRTAWWPDVRSMRSRGITGDYAPPEKSPFNLIIEDLFLQIHADMDAGAFDAAERKLGLINSYLDRVDHPGTPLSHYALGWPLPDKVWTPAGP
jgi:hypothetical protein